MTAPSPTVTSGTLAVAVVAAVAVAVAVAVIAAGGEEPDFLADGAAGTPRKQCFPRYTPLPITILPQFLVGAAVPTDSAGARSSVGTVESRTAFSSTVTLPAHRTEAVFIIFTVECTRVPDASSRHSEGRDMAAVQDTLVEVHPA